VTPACLAILFGLMALRCHGQQEAPPTEDRTGAPAVSPPGPNPASPHDNLRDPFWPPDYVRPVLPGEKVDDGTAAKIGEAEWRAVEKRLRETVKGVSRVPGRNGQDEYLAVINDKVVAVGERVSLQANGKTYRWKVARMTVQGGPVFERVLAAPPVAPPKK
jgi:hypothetical protein